MQPIVTKEFKPFQVLIGSVFLVLLAFSVLYSFERLYSDSGYYFFQLVNKQAFHIEHGRLVLFLSQSLTWIGVHLRLPLKLLVLLYSLTHVLFHFGLAYISYRYFKNHQASIVICLLQFVGIREAFFTPQFELFYGLSLLVFSYAFLKHYINQFKRQHGLLLVVIWIMVFSSHPMALLCFLVLFITLFREYKLYLKILPYLMISLSVYFILKKLNPSEYEQAKMNELFRLIAIGEYHKLFSLHYLFQLIWFFFKHYIDVFFLILFSIYTLIKNKNFFVAVVFSFAFLLVIILNCITINPDQYNRYVEQIYFPMAFISVLIFLYLKLDSWTHALILFLVIYRIVSTASTVNLHEKRHELMVKLINKTEKKSAHKFIVNDSLLKEQKEMANWSYGLESMIVSKALYDETVQLCLQQDYLFNENNKRIKSDEFIFRKWEIWKLKDLNAKYFKLDTLPYSSSLINN